MYATTVVGIAVLRGRVGDLQREVGDLQRELTRDGEELVRREETETMLKEVNYKLDQDRMELNHKSALIAQDEKELEEDMSLLLHKQEEIGEHKRQLAAAKLVVKMHESCTTKFAAMQSKIEVLESMNKQLVHTNNVKVVLGPPPVRMCGMGMIVAQTDAADAERDGHGGKLWVSRVVPQGAADLSGNIFVHDELLLVDGHAVENLNEAFQ